MHRRTALNWLRHCASASGWRVLKSLMAPTVAVPSDKTGGRQPLITLDTSQKRR
jgi:hypothetical protein